MYPEKVYIEPTKRTPWIVLEPGRIFIMGRSIIENPAVFYESGLNWITDFVNDWSGKTKIELGFEYINTGSIKWLYIFLRQLAASKKISDQAEVTWYYEEGDEDMCELGIIIRSLVVCQFNIVEVVEMNDKLYEEFLSAQN
jgi:SiaC family regulatory phosphoprotein